MVFQKSPSHARICGKPSKLKLMKKSYVPQYIIVLIILCLIGIITVMYAIAGEPFGKLGVEHLMEKSLFSTFVLAIALIITGSYERYKQNERK